MYPNKLLLIPLLTISQCLFAQQASLTAGGQASGSGGTISYSVGQAFYITQTGAGGNATQGLEQPNLTITPLPVKLLYFTAKAFDNYIDLDWATAMELNNKHFIIERSAPTRPFVKLDSISSKGNSTQNQYYSYKDRAPLSGLNIYRLQQVDDNQDISYSDIALARLTSRAATFISVYPNPVLTELKVLVRADERKEYRFILLDGSGKRLEARSMQCQVGINQSVWNLASYPAGSYTLQLLGDEPHSFPIIKR